MIQAVLEIVLMLSVAVFFGYKIGRFIAQKKSSKLQDAFDRQAQKLEELEFDLNQCVQTRRRVQSQMYDLQKKLETRLETRLETSQTVVDAKGKAVTPALKKPHENGTAKKDG